MSATETVSVTDTGMAAAADPAIAGKLAALRRRQRAVGSLRWGVHGLLVGAVAACAGAVVAWVAAGPSLGVLALVVLGGTLVGGLAGALLGAAARVDDLKLARALDRAAGSEDRFASALQLAGHHHRERARLLVEDAVARVGSTTASAAIPARVPGTARWLPVPVAVAAALLAVLPPARTQAAATPEPEISADDWKSLHEDFHKDLAEMPKAQTPEEEDLQKQLEELAKMLERSPDAKDALKEIARLSEKVEAQRRAAGVKNVSMRAAARAVSASELLKAFAQELQAGDYASAAEELARTAEELNAGEKPLDAAEMEAMAADLARLAEQDAADKEFQEACKNAGQAAGSMNRKQLAEAMKKLSEQLKKNSGKLKKSDSLAKRKSALDKLKRRMNQCKNGSCNGDGDNDGENFANRAGQGGKKAGRGTMAKWDGGKLAQRDETREAELSDTAEGPGASHKFQTVSPDERAQSGKGYAELYAEFVHKAEADLDLESVPVAEREYLRKYFNAIRPKEAPPAPAAEPGAEKKDAPAPVAPPAAGAR